MQNLRIKYFSIVLFCVTYAAFAYNSEYCEYVSYGLPKPPDKIEYFNTEYYDAMSYGLPETPDKVEYFDVDEGDGMIYGITRKETFFIDLNGDGKKDKITRGRFDTMTAHGYTFYEIELHGGQKLDMEKFRTVEGADCFLQAYKFEFSPFVIVKASRPWEENWIHPTPAKIEKYQLINGELKKISETSGGILCDVRELL